MILICGMISRLNWRLAGVFLNVGLGVNLSSKQGVDFHFVQLDLKGCFKVLLKVFGTAFSFWDEQILVLSSGLRDVCHSAEIKTESNC